MKLEAGQVWKNSQGVLVKITHEVSIEGKVYYYTGENQRGERGNYDLNGVLQSLSKKSHLVEQVEVVGMDAFKAFNIGSLWCTHGGRVWEIIAIYNTTAEEFPIIANEVLPDGTLHANIKRFDWNGQPHDGSASVLWRKCS